jgi:putative endonuclease
MKQGSKKGERNKIGAYGEDIAANYLKKLGHTILDTNYLKKWGEIDVVSRLSATDLSAAGETRENKEIIHFVEVKTVSYETRARLEEAVSYGTWRPEENVHHKKIQRMYRTIESWMMEHKYDGDWQIDVISVKIVPRERYATVKYIPNIIIG